MRISFFIETELTPESIVKEMLRSAEVWNMISLFIHDVLLVKK